jgi:hypothetical protein
VFKLFKTLPRGFAQQVVGFGKVSIKGAVGAGAGEGLSPAWIGLGCQRTGEPLRRRYGLSVGDFLYFARAVGAR